MSYQVFARKYRPQTFDDLIGQEAVSRTLKNAIEAERFAHAYIFFGPRGCGKTTAARILARALNCKKGPTPKPCGKCESCVEAAAGTAIDVMEIDAASHTGVDNVRDVIIEGAALRPARDRFKVFILDEAHMLSKAAFNALLKTIEEPPEHVVFMMATTEPAKIPATIFSRCQRYRIRPFSEEAIVGHLKTIAKDEKLKAGPKVLTMIARAAGGAMRDALSLLDQAVSVAGPELDEALVADLLGQLPEETLRGVAAALLGDDPQALWKELDGFFAEGHDGLALLRGLRERFHEGFLAALKVDDKLDAAWKKIFAEASVKSLAYVEKRLASFVEEARRSDAPRQTVELGLLGLLDEPFDLGELLGRLEALEGRVASGAPAPAAAPAVPDKKKPRVVEEREEPAEESAPEPVADRAPSRPVDAPEAWRKIMNWFREEQPRIHGFLSKAQLEIGPRAWKLRFASKFEMAGCQRSAKLIEEKVSEWAGKPVGVEFELDQDAPSAAPKGPLGTGSKLRAASDGTHQWEEVPEDDPLRSKAGVKNITDILGGKLKRAPKKGG